MYGNCVCHLHCTEKSRNLTYILYQKVFVVSKAFIYVAGLFFRKYPLSTVQGKTNIGIISLKGITIKVNSAKKYFKAHTLMGLDYHHDF